MLPPSPWPPASGLTTVVVPRPAATLTISASTTILAPGALILSVLRTPSTYPAWNAFVPHIDILSQPPSSPPTEPDLLHLNTSFILNVVMDPAHPTRITPTQVRVTDISTPEHPSTYVPQEVLDSDGSYEPPKEGRRVWRISWTTEGGFVARGLRTERVSEIVELEEGRCEYRTWECQGGVLARVVKWKFEGVLGERFGGWCEGLRGECERRAREGEEGGEGW